jgi:prepilin-type processing-associated H-X9-DG protein
MIKRILEVFVGVLCCAIILAILYPVVETTRTHPSRSECLSHVKQCMIAQLIYSDDYNGRLPPCTSWMDATQEYIKNDSIYHCPLIKDAKKDEYGYAMNVAVSSVKTTAYSKPDQVPVLFDSVLLARNACSGFYGFPEFEKRGTSVGFADGHVKVLSKEFLEGKR